MGIEQVAAGLMAGSSATQMIMNAFYIAQGIIQEIINSNTAGRNSQILTKASQLRSMASKKNAKLSEIISKIDDIINSFQSQKLTMDPRVVNQISSKINRLTQIKNDASSAMSNINSAIDNAEVFENAVNAKNAHLGGWAESVWNAVTGKTDTKEDSQRFGQAMNKDLDTKVATYDQDITKKFEQEIN